MIIESTGTPILYLGFTLLVIVLLAVDFFQLVDMAERFHLLKYGLAVILMFIGAKMLLLDVYKIPVGIALGTVGLILLVSVAASLLISGNIRPPGPECQCQPLTRRVHISPRNREWRVALM